MTYNSIYFLVFLAFFLLLYSVVPSVRARQYVLLAANLVFYLLAGSLSCLLILGAGFIAAYISSLKMGAIYEGYERERLGHTAKEAARLLPAYKKRAFRVLLPALLFILGVLIYIKVGKLLGAAEARSFLDFRFSRILVRDREVSPPRSQVAVSLAV